MSLQTQVPIVEKLDPSIEDQFVRFEKDEFRSAPKELALLRCLLSKDSEARFTQLQSNNRILLNYVSQLRGSIPPPGDERNRVLWAAKETLDRLRIRLPKYYSSHPADPVVISVAMTGSCRPKVVVTSPPMNPAVGVCISPLGNDRDAFIEYLLEKYQPPQNKKRDGEPGLSPKKNLIKVRDVHARSKENAVRTSYYKELKRGLRRFLRRSAADSIAASFIFGWLVDKQYEKTIKEAIKGLEDKVEFYRLYCPAPMLNVLLLDFDDGTHEVLFGWGQLEDSKPEVFTSTNEELVQVFSNYYNALQQYSLGPTRAGVPPSIPSVAREGHSKYIHPKTGSSPSSSRAAGPARRKRVEPL
jgi:hypothetical protein